MCTYQYDLVKELSFVRYGGTDEELRAANILLREIEAAGGKGELMDFTIPADTLEKCSLRVTAPFEREIDVIPYGLTGSFPEGGASLKLYYAARGTADDYIGVKDLSDSIVLVNELNIDVYKLLLEKKAAAFIVIWGKHYHENINKTGAYARPIRDLFLPFGKIPGFMIAANDATDLIRDEAEMIHVELIQHEYDATSRNVLAVVPGTEVPEESIVLTAHYDSVRIGTGSWDNATGAATLMYIYRHFVKNPPRRTMRFVWCGSEEQGLYGSQAYVKQHEDLIPEIKFCFNFDMCGTVLGQNQIFITGTNELKTFAEQFCHAEGYSADIRPPRVHSSDSAPFADKGIPAIGLSRGSSTAEIHTINDLMFPIGPKQLKQNGDFAIKMIAHVTNSVVIPVPTGMPDDMKKALDKYFYRDKMDKKEEK